LFLDARGQEVAISDLDLTTSERRST